MGRARSGPKEPLVTSGEGRPSGHAGAVHAARGSGTAGVVAEAGDDLAELAPAPAECDAAAAGLVPVDPLPAGVR